MVQDHARAVKQHLIALQQQLDILPSAVTQNAGRIQASIGTPSDFARQTRELHIQMQHVSQQVGSLFAVTNGTVDTTDPSNSIGAVLTELPISGADTVGQFASMLGGLLVHKEARETAQANAANRKR